MKIHLDTDLGGDIDDLCALALLLASPGVEITGITTVGDTAGRRCGYVKYVLQMAGRSDIPVAAGADVSLGCFRWPMGFPDDAAYWPEPIAPCPNPIDDALRLIERSAEQGATVVAVGPYTNLSLLERRRPGILAATPLFLMGFFVRAIPAGFPSWDVDVDWNVQSDVSAARHILAATSPTLIPVEMTVQTSLRRAYLPRLRDSNALGGLIARQAEAFARDERYEQLYGQTCPGLPDDTINFLHDPLACAVALAWDVVSLETLPLTPEIDESGFLRAVVTPGGKSTRIVTAVDAPRFGAWWVDAITGFRTNESGITQRC